MDKSKNVFSLDISPESALQFTLSRGSDGDKNSEGAARCVMTLTHPGNSTDHLAFKVKTTQPRRYLVRPNQGIVAPGTSEIVNILLVEKDKQMLLQSFDRLGQSALDHSKDKFLVQSCKVDKSFGDSYVAKKAKLSEETGNSDSAKARNDLGESLTNMWNNSSSSEDVEIHNKKLQVRHVVASSPNDQKAGNSQVSSSRSSGGQNFERNNLENMTSEQMFMEISSLRRKYDELVTFSVNLTAERDILNNTLEQTKRDLNKQIARSASNKASEADISVGTQKKSGWFGSLLFFFLIATIFFLLGAKLVQLDDVSKALHKAPLLGDLMKMEL